MYAYKDLLELAGLTTRVYTLISTLHALPPVRDFVPDEDQIALDGVSICVPERTARSGAEGQSGSGSGSGRNEVLFDGDEDFEKLGLSGTSGAGSMDGSLMVPLKLVIKHGEHLMITGPVSYIFLYPANSLEGRRIDISAWRFRMEWARLLSHVCSLDFGKRSVAN